MQILGISIYGINKRRRDVIFNLGKLNVLTGASGTGKSSLLHIIEYCLGSSTCGISKGLIRNNVEWYSLLLSFDDCEVFLARKAPNSGFDSNSICDIKIAKKIKIPEYAELEESTNIEGIINYLSRKIGISEVNTEVDSEHTRTTYKINFKHTLPFILQEQEEVASRKALFHRQTDHWVNVSIKDTLPYILGAVEEQRLGDMQELRSLKRERTLIQKQLNEMKSLKGDGLRKGYELYAECCNFGILNRQILENDEDLLAELFKVNQLSIEGELTEKNILEASTESNQNSESYLYVLKREIEELQENKLSVSNQISRLQDYMLELNSAKDEFTEQSARLKTMNLLKVFNTNSSIFGNEINSLRGRLESNARRLSNELQFINRSKPRILEDLGHLKLEEKKLILEINKRRSATEAIYKQNKQLLEQKSLERRKENIRGRVSLYLESITSEDTSKQLESKINLLEGRIKILERELDRSNVKAQFESQLSLISNDMTIWARELRLEHSDYPVRFDSKKATVVVDTPDGPVSLDNMGSGENWVGYHLVTILAFAKWFIKKNRPVPRFVVLDQPTQVYFPSDTSTTGDLSEILEDEDRNAVTRMFNWLSRVSDELAPNLQIIVTDHADINEPWFQSCVIKPKWRGNEALIPHDWLINSD
ncbi:DUF3732 domain-containing protein [Vibrio cholerae]|uniref:DUF3732 domain-containing protein n=1 Tax=Vibrio cholerae TaxID=666 RepID=UPI000BA906E0|nr:DUF3732 domain-containing protein [Vibrio cholerae]PAS29115.1 hypothetical protein CGT71_13195 [Vibrio cholerae]